MLGRRGSARRRLVLALTLMAMVVGAAKAAADPPPLLHSQLGANAGVYDHRGRQVLLRGVNLNGLGDYFQVQPAIPQTLPVTRDEFAQIAAVGMNSVRLIVSWSALEPQPGTFDEAYIARVRQAVGWARDAGLYVILDMHQDAWGKYIASPPDVVCPPGLSPSNGWDGAPDWATITDGMSTCHLRLRELSQAVAQAWQNFYLDRNGIQGQLVATWAHLAGEFAADPTVAGYDLLNEPNPGFLPGVSDGVPLGQFYARAIAAIRGAEQSAPGGVGHIAFFEPGVLWSAAATDSTPPPGFTGDSDIVFSPHLYAGSLSADGAVGMRALTVSDGFSLAQSTAQGYGTTVWSGEWGWFGDPKQDEPQIDTYAREEDAHLYGGAWWQWKQSCGDPHQFSGPGSPPYSTSPSLNRLHCPQNQSLGIPPTTRRALWRAYPRAAPGHLVSLRSDPVTGEVTLRGAAAAHPRDCTLELWVPSDRVGRPQFDPRNVDELFATPYAGGWLVTGCAHDDYELRRVASVGGAGAGAGSADALAGGSGSGAGRRGSGGGRGSCRRSHRRRPHRHRHHRHRRAAQQARRHGKRRKHSRPGCRKTRRHRHGHRHHRRSR